MKRTRTIHSDRKTSYRINFSGREISDDLEIQIFDESGIVLYETTIPASRLNGVTDLHFKYRQGKIEWDGPSSILVNP